jgi:hypothetical protein
MNTAPLHIVCGLYALELLADGKTVGEWRRELSSRLAIPRDAAAVIDGWEVEESVVPLAGQVLTFVRRSGEMGPAAEE